MTLSNSIEHAILLHSQQLNLLRNFVRDVHASVIRQPTEQLIPPMSKETAAEFKELGTEIANFMIKTAEEMQELPPNARRAGKKRTFRSSKAYSAEALKALWSFFIERFKLAVYPDLLCNMTLTHTITILEALLSDFLVAIFTHRRNTLKSEMTATYEAILSYSSMKQLVNDLAVNRAKRILEENIDDVAERIDKLFSVDLSRVSEFSIVREAFYRRHVIVHNNCKTDKKYCAKVDGSKIGVELKTDFEYLEILFNAIGQFIDYLDGGLSRKMRYKRSPLSNQLLHPPHSTLDEMRGPS